MEQINKILLQPWNWGKQALGQLPYIGIVVFAASSVNALGHLLIDHAEHKSVVYWLAAVFVEGFTAWLISAAVGEVHYLTRSRISDQDRRFHWVMFGLYVTLSIPTLVVSCIANRAEFGGSFWLGILFPSLCVACAAGAAIPATVAHYERRRQGEREEASEKREERRTERERQRQERAGALLESLGSAGATLMLYCENPGLTQVEAAQELGISRQAVGQHLRKLEQMGAIERNGRGIEILIDMRVHSGAQEP